MKSCPACGQNLPVVRYGVTFTLRKASIIDLVLAHPGIPLKDIATRLGGSHNTLKVHIHQINDNLASTDYRIRGQPWRGYRVIKVGDTPPVALARDASLG